MKKPVLTELQLALMQVLWRRGEGTVGEIADALGAGGRALASTTVATMLQRLAKQGWVAHRRDGRQFIYRAKVKEHDAAKGALKRLVSTFFAGRISALTAQLLESEEITAAELAEMRRLIKKKEGGA